MGDEEFQYTGTPSLEILEGALHYNRYLEERLLAFMGQETKALDFGAGIGRFAKLLSQHGITVDCVEADKTQRERIASEGFAAYADILDVDQTYPRIFSLNVLEHIEDDRVALESLHSRISEGGELFLYVPAFMVLYNAFDKKVGHFRRYRMAPLCRLLHDVGFAVRKAHYVDSLGFIGWVIFGLLPAGDGQLNPRMVALYDRWVFPLSALLDRVLGKWFGKNLLIVAKK